MNRSRSSHYALAVLSLLLSLPAFATNYSLWIHGRNSGTSQIGHYDDWSKWGSSSSTAGVNKKAVNWDGYSHISSQNALIRNALDCFCTGDNWCYIAAHSAGDLQIGYALALWGGTARHVKNAVPNASGVCGDASGSPTQTGWNIRWVDVAGGAAGGSELADDGDWAVSEPLVSDLVTTTARAMYNHNSTRSKWFYMFAGSKGAFYSGILPGQDDGAVAYHSSGAVSGSSGGSYCNPSDWFCNDLTTGTAACQGGRAKWSYHTVQYRDDGEDYDHGATVGLVRADMASYAR
jgi:hypothetical protein